MKIIFHGHSCLELQLKEHTLFIDPFITGNPAAKISKDDIKKCDYIILTHGHGDHYGDTDFLAKKFDATVLATFELAVYVSKKGIKTHELNLGGGFNFPFGRVKLTLAHHSSSTPDGTYVGEPAGVLVTADGKTVYHAGDTSLFDGMKIIGDTNKIDYAFLPIGDNYTMGVDDAVKATELLNPHTVVPIHYNTFDLIKADAEQFKRKVESIGKKCLLVKPGESIEC